LAAFWASFSSWFCRNVSDNFIQRVKGWTHPTSFLGHFNKDLILEGQVVGDTRVLGNSRLPLRIPPG
jgi:hypothetical protein